MRRLGFALALLAGCGSPAEMPGPPDAGPTGIPLQTWVHQLLDERSGDAAEPDTVEDKDIIDTEDEAAFASLFGS
jgi:hypothetical protein